MMNIPATLAAAVAARPAPAILYPRERCAELRARCMMQARKHRDAGRKSDAATWVGYAVYWSTRTRTGLPPGECETVVARRVAAHGKPQATLPARAEALAAPLMLAPQAAA
jgi:hypothetical protein